MSEEFEKGYKTIVMGPGRKELSYGMTERILSTVPFKIDEIISNHQWGFNQYCEQIARHNEPNIPVREFKIVWKPVSLNGRNDNAAGAKVNAQMIKEGNAEALVVIYINKRTKYGGEMVKFKLIDNMVAQAKTAGLIIQSYFVDTTKEPMEFIQYKIWTPDMEKVKE